MKKVLAVILAAGIGFAVATLIVTKRLATRHAAQLAEQQSVWKAEKAALEAAVDKAKGRTKVVRVPVAHARAETPAISTKLSPEELIAKLVTLRPTPANAARSARQSIYWLEELIAAGPAALPAIREFLSRNEDIEFPFGSLNQGKGGRSGDLVIPPSLRFGLFDAAKQIGGSEAEKLLADVLGTTGRGVEVAWLARTLQDLAPNKYREAALAAAHELLARPAGVKPVSALDRNERDQLFSMLTMYGDTSYVSAAQGQVLRADGEVDRSALKYLEQSLGPQAVTLAAQWYNDPRLTDSAKKEPFARLALNYVGADPQANEFYLKAINDLALTGGHRKNLIEDLNQDGFPDTKNLSARDLPLIQNRLLLIEQLAPQAVDPVNAAAFKEAYKDLLNMRERVARSTQPTP